MKPVGRTEDAATLLRHNSGSAKDLKVDKEAYASVEDLLEQREMKAMGVTKEELVRLVDNQKEKRLMIKKDEEGKLSIKATQGHTRQNVDTAAMMDEVKTVREAGKCYHGTSRMNLPSIYREGLTKGEQGGNGVYDPPSIFLEINMKG